jgi:hypothetical protein
MPRTSWPPYQTLRPLIHAHVGRTAVVMGGGPTLAEAMKIAPADALYISVNDHGLRFFKRRGDPRRCSYVVACDKIEKRARFDCRDPGDDGQPWGLPVISRHMFADYRLLHLPAPNSGMSGAYFARLLGCAPVIITGMDCYTGGTYHDDPKAGSTGRNIRPADHRSRWTKLGVQYPGMYRTIGCDPVLARHFGTYNPEEKPEAPAPLAQLVQELRRFRCVLKAEATICQRPFKSGQVLDLMQREVEQLMKEKRATRIAIDE